VSVHAPAPTSRASFTPAPEGLHLAVCCDVVDLGIVASKFGDKAKCRLVFQLEAVNPATGRRHDCRKLYTLSLHPKAALRKDLEGWRGRKFAVADLQFGFNLNKLLGANCQLQVVHDVDDDGARWANITAILPAPKGVAKLLPVGYTRVQDRDRRAS
jgi:hypothetical protein